MLLERQVEGIIAVDTPIRFQTNLPVVSVSGHDEIEGVTNVVLNHRHAAELSVGHLLRSDIEKLLLSKDRILVPTRKCAGKLPPKQRKNAG
jgi:DNA-binding LacI/PurR family transcriptional regulator